MSRRIIVAHCAPIYPAADFGFTASQLTLTRGWMKYELHEWPSARDPITKLTARPELNVLLLTEDKYHYKPVFLRCQPIQYNRNLIARHALADQGEPDAGIFTSRPADVLVWQDSDVEPDGLAVLELVQLLTNCQNYIGAVGVPLPKQYAAGKLSFNVVLPDGVAGHPANKVFKVRRMGFGLIAIRAQVFRDIVYPWFSWDDQGEGKDPLGEDYGFCDRMVAAGYEILAWPRPDVTHNFTRKHGLETLVDQELSDLARKLGEVRGANPIQLLRDLIAQEPKKEQAP